MCAATEFLLDAEKLVVLRHPVGAAERTGLDLTGVGRHCDVGDGGVLRFAGTVGSNRGIAVTMRHFDSVKGLGERTNLVDFDKNRVGSTHFDTLLEEADVGYEQVVTYELAAFADTLGEAYPVVPVVLIQTVFDGVDGVLVDKFF